VLDMTAIAISQGLMVRGPEVSAGTGE
jgi:hypothetical protein